MARSPYRRNLDRRPVIPSGSDVAGTQVAAAVDAPAVCDFERDDDESNTGIPFRIEARRFSLDPNSAVFRPPLVEANDYARDQRGGVSRNGVAETRHRPRNFAAFSGKNCTGPRRRRSVSS